MDITDVSWWIGVIASIFVLISFLFRNIRTIRLISIVGCIVFVVYGVMINAFAVWLLNGILILVHIFFLIRMKRGKKAPAPIQSKKEDGARLDRFNRDSFSKKGLRSLPWFISSDLEKF